jgi:hypothetical protein
MLNLDQESAISLIIFVTLPVGALMPCESIIRRLDPDGQCQRPEHSHRFKFACSCFISEAVALLAFSLLFHNVEVNLHTYHYILHIH